MAESRSIPHTRVLATAADVIEQSCASSTNEDAGVAKRDPPRRARDMPYLDQAEESVPVTTAIALKDITIYPVVEQQGPFFDVFEFFPTLTKELLEENRPWLQPTFIDPASGRLVLCVQSFVIKSPHHNILIDSCVGNDKPRPARPFWNMMKSDRFEKGLRGDRRFFRESPTLSHKFFMPPLAA
jgi:hypothetical protein